MKKLSFLTLTLISISSLCAQNFSQTVPPTLLKSVFRGDMDVADIDGDQDLDVLITGAVEDVPHTTLYRNDGNSTFKVVPAPFNFIVDSDVEFGDIDGDGDADLVMIGKKFSFNGDYVFEVYTNDGTGSFSLLTSKNLNIPEQGNLKLGDVDNDNDLDLIINGITTGEDIFLRFFINDSDGNFQLDTNSNLAGTRAGSLILADMNNDGSDDIFVIGGSDLELLNGVAYLYLNDGQGNFQESDSIIDGGAGVAKAADIDGDDDLDIIFSGKYNSGQPTTSILLNDGLGEFTRDLSNNLDGLYWDDGDMAVFDANNDQHPDIFLGGMSSFGINASYMYINDGSGNFSKSPEMFFFDFNSGKFLPFDFDNDGDQDLMFGGVSTFGMYFTQLFMNNGTTTSSVNPSPVEDGISIYPNPSSTNFITINRLELSEDLKISIIDGKGQTVTDIKIDTTSLSEKVDIDVTHLIGGIYFIKIEESNRVIMEKFVRQN